MNFCHQSSFIRIQPFIAFFNIIKLPVTMLSYFLSYRWCRLIAWLLIVFPKRKLWRGEKITKSYIMEKMRWIFLVKVILWTSTSLLLLRASPNIFYVRFPTIKQFLFLLSHYIRTGEQWKSLSITIYNQRDELTDVVGTLDEKIYIQREKSAKC